MMLLVASVSPLFAATHTITFADFAYSPNALTVSVGDVIVWEGDFTMHPLQSDPGAPASFSNSSGTSFSFTVPSAGTYGYHCTVHGGPGVGMSGSFTAVEASVNDLDATALLKIQTYPNPTSEKLIVTFTLDRATDVRLVVVDINGNERSHVNDFYTSGTHVMHLGVASLPIGTYYYRLQTSAATVTKKFSVFR